MPGVPPNALNNLKRVIKGLFKREKAKKQDQQDRQLSSTPGPGSSKPDAAASTTNASDSKVDKQLPSTKSPIEEGESSAAPPQGQSAQTESVPQPHGLSEERRVSEVSPTSTVVDNRSEPVSAIENDQPPIPPPKDDTLSDAPAAKTSHDLSQPVKEPETGTEMTKENLAPAAPPAAPPIATVGEGDAIANAAKSEETTNSGTAVQVEPTATEPEVMKDLTNKPNGKPNGKEIPVIVETQEVTVPKAATGMSATSGPLEDFPDVGHLEE